MRPGVAVKMEKKYGKQARIGMRFYDEVEEIKLERIKNGKSKDKPSTEKISNLIARHKGFKKVKEDIIKLEEDLIDEE